MLRKLIALTLAVLTLSAVLLALPKLTTEAHSGGPHLRIAHLSPDSPAVDIYINKELVVKGLKYKEVTEYLAVEGINFQFVIVPAGGKPTDSVTEKPIEMTFRAKDGSFFSLAAVGSLKDKSFELFRFPADKSGEDETAKPTATKAATASK